MNLSCYAPETTDSDAYSKIIKEYALVDYATSPVGERTLIAAARSQTTVSSPRDTFSQAELTGETGNPSYLGVTSSEVAPRRSSVGGHRNLRRPRRWHGARSRECPDSLGKVELEG
jgi:hypothetical protein